LGASQAKRAESRSPRKADASRPRRQTPNDFALSAEHLLPTDLQTSSESVLNWFATQPGFTEHYWPAWRSSYPPDFVTYLDGIIANSLPAAQQSDAADSA
jgi:hypothetical protein